MPVAWNGRAAVLSDLARGHEAIDVLTQAVKATGGNVDVRGNLVVLLEQQNRLAEAIDEAERLLAVVPDHLATRLTLGIALLHLGRHEEALHQNRLLANSHPNSPQAHLNLGETLMATGQYQGALAAYERTLELDTRLVAARIGMGLALAMLRRFDEADTVFRESAHLAPAESFACFQRIAASAGLTIPFGWQVRAIEIFLSRYWIEQQHCDWRHREAYLDHLRNYAEHLLVTKSHAFDESLGFQLFATALQSHLRLALVNAISAGIAAAVTPVRRRKIRRSGLLRIGFLSPNFREHPSAQLNWRLLALLDRSRFNVFGYSLHHGEGPLRQKIIQFCDVFREVSALTSWEIAKRISLDDIDVLVDLGGYADHARPEVLAMRPAPVQASYLGAAGATGTKLVDYRITDHFTTPPEDAAFWSEKLVFLPNTVAIYNNQEEIAAAPPSRLACGLPERGFVFCCFNASYKIEPDVFAVWMRLLAQVPDSVLWLLDTGEATCSNLRREAVARGIASDRLVFAPRLPRAEHLARHACADLFIDTFYCGAMATAGDALWAGLPVLTCPGSTMAARMSGTIVRAAGLPELVVPDRETYELMALRLATQSDELPALREKLARNRTTCTLFDTPGRVRDLGRAFTMMWERHAAGLPPASFDVPDGND